MRRNLAMAFCLLCFAATTGFAQSRLNGKWATDLPADSLTATDAQRKQSAQLDVTIDGVKSSGTLSLGGIGGTFYTYKDGTVAGNKVQFRTNPQPTEPSWTIEMVDDNTVLLYRGPISVPVPTPTRPPAPGGGTPVQGAANAAIRGTVQDKSKALIPGVTVTATNVDTGVKSTAITNEAGLYAFFNVAPGRYSMTANLSGFNATTFSNLSFLGSQFRQDFTLVPMAAASASPTAASCGENGMVWCALLHRAK